MALAHTIKAAPALAPVSLLLLTPMGQRAPHMAEMEAVCAGYLTKPVRQAALHDCLAAMRERAWTSPSVNPTSPPESCQQGHTNVLVVEDHPVNQQVLVHMLQRYGCKVDVAGNGREAVHASAHTAYDCLFMDCQMPEMDGYEATAAIRQREGQTGQRVPIIALTASAMPSDRERCLVAGMDDYLSKPAKPQELMTMLQKWTAFSTYVSDK
jgi:CheY-like chemotaxis protein